MTILAASLAAYRDAFRRPLCLFWVGAIPLAISIAAHHLIAESAVDRSLRSLVDFDVVGLRPLAPAYWLPADLPWIWFAAVFAYRWRMFDLAAGHTWSVVDLMRPLWHWRTIMIVAAISLTAAYCGMALLWMSDGLGITSAGSHLAYLIDQCDARSPEGNPTTSLRFCALSVPVYRENYLRELRYAFYLAAIPAGAIFLSRIELVPTSETIGRGVSGMDRPTREGRNALFLQLLVVGTTAGALFLAADFAVGALPDTTATCISLLFAPLSFECKSPGILEARLAAAIQVIAFLFAVFGITALLSKTQQNGRGRPPGPEQEDRPEEG